MTKFLFKLKCLGRLPDYQFMTIEADSLPGAETKLMRNLLDKGIADRRVIIAIYEEKWHINRN